MCAALLVYNCARRLFLGKYGSVGAGWTGTPGLMLFRENGTLFYHFCPKILLF
jgi:hypothetical protein